MEKVILDLFDEEKVSVVKNVARAQIMDDLFEFLQSRYEGIKRIGATEFALPIATAKDPEGFNTDVYGVISVKIPDYYNKEGTTRTIKKFNVLKKAFDWETDPKTEKKIEKEKAYLEYAKKVSKIPNSDDFIYDYSELTDEDDD